ncbi:MAG: hypothetical protein AAF804_01700, partial [Bacteroidota bacterium]
MRTFLLRYQPMLARQDSPHSLNPHLPRPKTRSPIGWVRPASSLVLGSCLLLMLLVCLPKGMYGQKLIQGVVRAAPEGKALAGATVLVKGSSQGVFSDNQ